MPGGLGFCLCLFCPWDRSTDAGDQKYSGVEALIFFSPNEGGQKARPDPPSVLRLSAVCPVCRVLFPVFAPPLDEALSFAAVAHGKL